MEDDGFGIEERGKSGALSRGLRSLSTPRGEVWLLAHGGAGSEGRCDLVKDGLCVRPSPVNRFISPGSTQLLGLA